MGSAMQDEMAAKTMLHPLSTHVHISFTSCNMLNFEKKKNKLKLSVRENKKGVSWTQLDLLFFFFFFPFFIN